MTSTEHVDTHVDTAVGHALAAVAELRLAAEADEGKHIVALLAAKGLLHDALEKMREVTKAMERGP